MPALRGYLGERGVGVTRLEPIHATLEDVFVSLTAGHGNSAARSA
jgi:hypothetical protein